MLGSKRIGTEWGWSRPRVGKLAGEAQGLQNRGQRRAGARATTPGGGFLQMSSLRGGSVESPVRSMALARARGKGASKDCSGTTEAIDDGAEIAKKE